MMERLGTMDREAVERELELSDEAHTAITRRHFRRDWRDPEHYDVVLSTERLSAEECADEIERVMELPRFQRTEESLRDARNRALEWSVRAQLRRDPRTANANFALECIDGFVRVKGAVSTRAAVQEVSEVVASVPGVRTVDNQLLHGVPGVTRLRASS
jgi:hypothetical protein